MKPLLFDNLNHRFLLGHEITFITQAVYIPGRIILQCLMRSFPVIVVNKPTQGQQGDLDR
jgi:hypothetical protein